MSDSSKIARNAMFAGLALAAFALVSSALVALTFDNTKEQIAENERQMILRSLHALVPPKFHDNEIVEDLITVQAAGLGYRGQLATIYRARKNGEPVAAILNVVAPDGYSGSIRMLVGVNVDGTISGVRVVSHRETPGLGDAIELQKSKWILNFDNRSLKSPAESQWKVKKDGGDFDQLTGATITPRAVVKAVLKALQYYNKYQQQIFSAPSEFEAEK